MESENNTHTMMTRSKAQKRSREEIQTLSDDDFEPENKRQMYLEAVKLLNEEEQHLVDTYIVEEGYDSELDSDYNPETDSDAEEDIESEIDSEEQNTEETLPEEEQKEVVQDSVVSEEKPLVPNLLQLLMTGGLQITTEEENGGARKMYIKEFTRQIKRSKTISKREKRGIIEKMKELLGKIFSEDEDILRIMKLPLEDSIKMSVIKTMIAVSESQNSGAKAKEWVDRLLDIPFGKYQGSEVSFQESTVEEINSFLERLRDSLDDSVYGQDNVKESLLEIITNGIVDSESKGQCLGLVGPPGIGKTSIIMDGLAKALNRPCVTISLAGVKDVHTLIGHGFTYEGSRPGRIVEALTQVECMNPIVYFDELDKIDERDGASVIYKLMEIIDYSQNHKFEDTYFSGIPMDLSRCTFIFSLNNKNQLNRILRDRIELIEVGGFTIKDKIQICKNFLIPREMRVNKFEEGDIIISDEIIKRIIDDYIERHDVGVRQLKYLITKIFRRLSVMRFTTNVSYKMKKLKNEDGVIVIDYKMVDKLLKDVKKIEVLPYYL